MKDFTINHLPETYPSVEEDAGIIKRIADAVADLEAQGNIPPPDPDAAVPASAMA